MDKEDISEERSVHVLDLEYQSLNPWIPFYGARHLMEALLSTVSELDLPPSFRKLISQGPILFTGD